MRPFLWGQGPRQESPRRGTSLSARLGLGTQGMSLLVDVGGAWTAMGKLSQVPTRAGKSCPLRPCWDWTLEGSSNEVRAAHNAKALGKWALRQ